MHRQVSWEVAPWGSWRIFARSDAYEALVEATCAKPGTPLRAPTASDGLAPFCRDSFAGQAGLMLRCLPLEMNAGLECRLSQWSAVQL